MKYLKAGMLVRLSCGSLCVIIYPSSPRFCAKGVLEDGSLINVPSTEAEVLATAPKQDDKMFYRVAYAFGLPVKSVRNGSVLEASSDNGNEVVLFATNKKQELEIVCPEYSSLKQELEQLVKEQEHLAGLQKDLAKRIEDVKAKL